MSNEMAQDDDLMQEFLTESEEMLQSVERDLLGLEDSGDPEILNRIFRAMHTIKGTSSFLGFDQLVELTHHGEDLLNMMRRGEIAVSRKIIDTLLSVQDQLKLMLEDVRAHRSEVYDLTPWLEQIADCRGGAPAPKPATVLSGNTPAAEPAPAAPEAAAETPSAPAIEPPLDAIAVADPTEIAAPEPPAAAAETATESTASPEAVEASAEAPQTPETAPAKAKPAEQVERRRATDDEVAGSTMRVNVRKLDYLINLVGELVLERNRLVQISRDLTAGRLTTEDASSVLNQSTARLSFVTEELQNASLNTRMVPIDAVFRKVPRLVRDLSSTLNKKVDLVIDGKETEIDKTMIEFINDPMVHIIRNCMDHGIEHPADRVAAGKNETGTIHISASQEGDQIIVTIADDGGGIDPEKIRRKAVQRGLVSAEVAKSLSRRDTLDMIFQPGFSTVDVATNVSGRGVGMDVVRTNLKKLNGSVEVDSQTGKGTTVVLRVPLTMAILPVLLARVADEVYGIPLRTVVEILRIQPSDIHTVEGREVLSLHNRTLPLLRLANILQVPGETAQGELLRVVILATGELRFALLVDSLLGQESTVIKPMESLLRDCNSIAGATISGDGRVRLVLDPAGLVSSTVQYPGVH
jgi:two-component system chemotaxis sensor kinase CheA